MKLREVGKVALYRTPVLNRAMAPKYPYKINPGQLAAMVGFISATTGAVAEVGVAQGDTSVFLLEHLKTAQDPRQLLLLDTFAGFPEDTLQYELHQLGRRRAELDKFRYGDETRFGNNLRRLGYNQFRTIAGDASQFDWATIAPIGAVLLDIDVYKPTIEILENIYPHLEPGGGIVVDDCIEGRWPGSLRAYEEFINAHGLPFERVGGKGGVIRGGA